MLWIAPSEKDAASTSLEKRLWDAADQFRANSGLKAQEYSGPILGLIFLSFAEVRFAVQRTKLEGASASSREFSRRSSRVDEPAAYHAEGILYLAAEARFDYLLTLPEVADIGAKVNAAMREIEKHNPQLAGVLPKTYNLLTSAMLKELLKKVSEIPATLDYDAFGRIYEYFLGAFAMTEGQGGGEFYTPSSIVKLLTEIIEPFHGRILDPACGSGGMFVQSARFVAEHQKNPAAELAICGVEKTDETGRLCRLNLAVHGLEGDIKHGGNINSYYDDPHSATGSFDFVLANPPFNVNAVDKERLKDMVGHDVHGNARRFPFGLPLPVQQRIAGILSAYDELIENSQRRIKILESMARALYREWFVHFRFPGHEHQPRVPSSLGEIPQGWEVRKLGEIAEDMRRNVSKGQLEYPTPFVGLEHIPRRSLALDAWETTTELGSNKLEFKKGEVLFGKIRPYFHKVSVAPFDGLCSADTIVIRSRKPEHYAIVVGCVSSDEFVALATATSNGLKMPRANWSVLEDHSITIPTPSIASRFSAVIEPAIQQMQILIFQIQNLRRTRDLLLPRLLSSQIAVEAA